MKNKDYSDFVLIIQPGGGGVYQVTGSADGGDPGGTLELPSDLKERVEAFERNMLSGVVRGTREFSVDTTSNPDPGAVQLGRDIFNALINGERRSIFDNSLRNARDQNKGLRVVLRINAPELVAVPWELASNPDTGIALAASTDTPMVRYTDQSQGRPKNMTVKPPVRILGVVSSPKDLPELDVRREKLKLESALGGAGKVVLEWLEQPTREALGEKLSSETWHVLHFIGHGDFDEKTGDSGIALCDSEGNHDIFSAENLRWMLNDSETLRLVVLNSCEGGRSGSQPFSSMAAKLMQLGIPAVLAMQYPITDEAAKALSGALYRSLAAGEPIDAAVSKARVAIKTSGYGAEWATPVLYMRSLDGKLFEVPEDSPTNPVVVSPPQPAVVPQAGSGTSTPQPLPLMSGSVARPARRPWPAWAWALIGAGGLLVVSLLFAPNSSQTQTGATVEVSPQDQTQPVNQDQTQTQTPQKQQISLQGVWSGKATGGDGPFQVRLEVSKPCAIGENCGRLILSNPKCVDNISLISEVNKVIEFHVDNFADGSSPNCVGGSSGYFTIMENGELEYFFDSNYAKSTLKPVQK